MLNFLFKLLIFSAHMERATLYAVGVCCLNCKWHENGSAWSVLKNKLNLQTFEMFPLTEKPRVSRKLSDPKPRNIIDNNLRHSSLLDRESLRICGKTLKLIYRKFLQKYMQYQM